MKYLKLPSLLLLMVLFAASTLIAQERIGVHNTFDDWDEDDPRLRIGATMVGGFQALSHSNDDNSLFNIQPGFQTPAGNLNFNYLLDDDIVI